MTESKSVPEPPPVNRWIRDVPDREVIRFVIWAVLFLAAVVASSAFLIRDSEAHGSAHLPDDHLAWWGATSAGTFLLLTVLGGLFVFGTRAKWDVVTVWPLLGGPLVGIGNFVTFSAMGQTDPGSIACTGTQPCDVSFGFGAVLISVLVGLPIYGVFIGTYRLRRLAAHRYHRRSR